MQLTDILQPNCIKIPLDADAKQDAIYELVDFLADRVGIEDHDELKKAVWQRETTRTTGIGHNIAIPHGKCKGCSRLAMAIGITAKPIEFGAIDNRPVQVIILLASPLDQTGPHIQALASISRMLTNGETRTAFKETKTPAALYELIRQYETALANS